LLYVVDMFLIPAAKVMFSVLPLPVFFDTFGHLNHKAIPGCLPQSISCLLNFSAISSPMAPFSS
jgi:hypothetical protein